MADTKKTQAELDVEWAEEDKQKAGESPSDYARRLQDNAENRKQVLPGLTVNDDGQMVQLTPEEREKSSKAKSKTESKTETRTSGEPGFRLRK